MIRSTMPLLLLISAAGFLLSACGRHHGPDAAQALEQSFQSAEPELKQSIQTVSNGLRNQNYAQATKALAPLLQRPLSDAQKQAVGITLQQINQAIARDPSLDTKELYELRAKMFRAMQNGPRF